MNWKKTTNATFGIDEKGLVLVVLLQILGGDGSLLWLLFGSQIGISSVHSCPTCSVRYTSFSDISHIPQRMGSESGLTFPIYPLRWTLSSVQPIFELRVTICWILVGNDREFHHISFWYISFARCGPRNALSALQFCRAEHRGVVPFWWRRAGIERASSRHWWKCWLGSLSTKRCP